MRGREIGRSFERVDRRLSKILVLAREYGRKKDLLRTASGIVRVSARGVLRLFGELIAHGERESERRT